MEIIEKNKLYILILFLASSCSMYGTYSYTDDYGSFYQEIALNKDSTAYYFMAQDLMGAHSLDGNWEFRNDTIFAYFNKEMINRDNDTILVYMDNSLKTGKKKIIIEGWA